MNNRQLPITNYHCGFWQFAALALILLVAAAFRFQGLDWDRGYLFHPDERQILLVTSRIALPANALDFFSADSPLNPKFFSYGSLPIYLLKALGVFAPPAAYPVPWRDNILVSYALLGRALSGLFDLGTIVFTFLLGRRLYRARVGLLAAAGIAVTVLHIQLSHFYAVDTLLTFFVVATMFFAARFAETRARRDQIAMAVAFGLAMATKLSAFPLIVPILFAAIRAHPAQGATSPARSFGIRAFLDATRGIARRWHSEIWRVREPLRGSVLIALATFFLVEPYALLDPIRFIGQTGTEGLIARGWMDVPYTRQYTDTPAYAYPIAQSTVWGMGAPLGIVVWIGSALFVWSARKQRAWRDLFVLSFALVYFFIVGAQYAKHLRYLLPLIPFLFLMAAKVISDFGFRISDYKLRFTLYILRVTYSAGLLFAFVYSWAFVGIYWREHPWLAISRWTYQNIPAGATIALEHWDDNLPVSIRADPVSRAPIEYQQKILPMFDADDAAKLDLIVEALASSDYVILASQRLYASITRLPERYPISARYYRLLFSGELGFELAAFARNDPEFAGVTIMDNALALAGLPTLALLQQYQRNTIVWDWGAADESFTVYDHVMPLVFKKTQALPRAELVRRLLAK